MTYGKPSMERIHPNFFARYDELMNAGHTVAARQVLIECQQYCKELYKETAPNITTLIQGDDN